MPNLFRSIRSRWHQYCLEAACESSLDRWEREKPEYMKVIRDWIETDSIPDDYRLQTLCRIYQGWLEPKSYYPVTKR